MLVHLGKVYLHYISYSSLERSTYIYMKILTTPCDRCHALMLTFTNLSALSCTWLFRLDCHWEHGCHVTHVNLDKLYISRLGMDLPVSTSW